MGSDLPAQVEEAKRLVGDRKADAVMLGISVNDLEFGAVALFCAGSGKSGYCPDIKYKDGLTLAQWMAKQLKALPDRLPSWRTRSSRWWPPTVCSSTSTPTS